MNKLLVNILKFFEIKLYGLEIQKDVVRNNIGYEYTLSLYQVIPEPGVIKDIMSDWCILYVKELNGDYIEHVMYPVKFKYLFFKKKNAVKKAKELNKHVYN